MERLMQYVWQHRLLLQSDMFTVDGRRVSVLDPGRLNTDAGPDFFNAKVRIGERLWAGDVEIHVRASDWYRHNHDGNAAYDSVVLHVVDRDDAPVMRSNGEVIPQMVMRCATEFHSRYSDLVDRADIDLPCASEIASMPQLNMTDWITSLAYERLYGKADRMLDLLGRYTGDWEQVCYVMLARALGFSVNAEPMQRLAMSLPLSFLRKHSDSLTAVESLFFGQAALLENAPKADRYVESLAREYDFLAHKFSLHPLESPGWKLGRMRPQNLPYRRIAALANMVCGDFRVVRRLLEMSSPEEAVEMFRAPLTGYWSDHFSFNAPSGYKIDTMSRASASVLVINVAVPLIMAYGMKYGDDSMMERAAEWLCRMRSESNSIVALFVNAGIPCRDAFTSQALIQLRRDYCEKRRCMYCRLGHRLLAVRARRDD